MCTNPTHTVVLIRSKTLLGSAESRLAELQTAPRRTEEEGVSGWIWTLQGREREGQGVQQRADRRGRNNAMHGNSWIHNRRGADKHPRSAFQRVYYSALGTVSPRCGSSSCLCRLHMFPDRFRFPSSIFTLPSLPVSPPHTFLNTPTAAKHVPIGWEWHHLCAKCLVRPPPAKPKAQQRPRESKHGVACCQKITRQHSNTVFNICRNKHLQISVNRWLH